MNALTTAGTSEHPWPGQDPSLEISYHVNLTIGGIHLRRERLAAPHTYLRSGKLEMILAT